MAPLTLLEIHRQEFSFSAGHFTIFSRTEREAMHGHNYEVSLAMHVQTHPNGLSFDYGHYKEKMHTLCARLSRRFLLPSQSPYLRLDDEGEYWAAHFNGKILPFLKEDVVVLPLTNVTIEELARWFLQSFIQISPDLTTHQIGAITIKVYNGPGQSAGASWSQGDC